MKSLFLILPLAIFCSCAMPMPMQTAFDEAEFAPYAAPGTSTITGQAFLKTAGGEVRFGAGNPVELVPVTAYTTERYNYQVAGEIPGPTDLRLAKHTRTTIADGNGNFEFHELPAGTYYATCYISWQVPNPYGIAPLTTGGTACGTVKVGTGETAKVVVTR
jgi:hypothetical protein